MAGEGGGVYHGSHGRELRLIVNNAATITRRGRLNSDGIETQFAVNHLAAFPLANLLLDDLKRNTPARVVNVASQVESRGLIDFDTIGREEPYDRLQAYCRSKFANVLFTYELARRLRGTGVTVNCLHPGVVGTNPLSDFNGTPRILGRVLNRGRTSPDDAARHIVHLATAPELAQVTGESFKDGDRAESSARSRDCELGSRLWDFSSKMVGL